MDANGNYSEVAMRCRLILYWYEDAADVLFNKYYYILISLPHLLWVIFYLTGDFRVLAVLVFLLVAHFLFIRCSLFV